MSTLTGSSRSEPRYVLRDRESFFEAQRRNRRATWRLGAFCMIAVAVMGIPLALLVTPLVYGAALVIADIVNLFWKLPPGFWQQAAELAHFGLIALKALLDHKAAPPQALGLGAAVLLAPGTILSVLIWLGMIALFRRAGVGGALLALNARDPNPAELKELQFADVVQEMAIAAGLPAPRIMLVDTPGANLAAIGSSPEDAHIVVSRRLLNELSRDELEGAVAHSIAAIGNGDLRVAFRITAVLETYGILLAILNSPFGPQSRGMLWRIARSAFARSGTGDNAAKEVAEMAAILSRSVDFGNDDIDQLFAKKSLLRSIRNFVLFPIFFTNATIKISLWFFSCCMLGPSFALLWRTRKYLADACAVQLTRDPDGLARALRKLDDAPGAIPGSGWASHLFLVAPQSSGASSGTTNSGHAEILARAWAASRPQTEPEALQVKPAPAESTIGAIVTTYRAAAAGDARAAARVGALRSAVTALDPALAAQMPDPADLGKIRKGNAVTMARLRVFGRQGASPDMGSVAASQSNAEDGSGVSSVSMLGFYPSLGRRLKRLERMGAHLNAPTEQSGTWIVAAVVGLICAPFVLLAVALLLLLIGIMTLASLAFLVVWLAFIHQIFGFAAHH